MEIAEFFVVFIAVVSIPFCKSSEYGPKRIRYEFDAVRDAIYSIRKDISALFDKTDQLNISAVKDCGLCISDNKSSCLPVMDLDKRQDRAKMNDNNVLVKYQILMKAFTTEKKIKDGRDRQVQNQLHSMENAISESNKVANDRDRQVQDQLRSMENAISESNKVANDRDRQVQDKLRSMENAISESNRVANERDLQVQNQLRSMENAISEITKVANERDRQVQDKLRSMENAISVSNRVANERNRQARDKLRSMERDRQVQDKLRSMEQDKLRSMENAISESNKVANERDRQVQNQLRSMENAISEITKVANERDRQVRDKLRSMENAISESNRVANERNRQVRDKLRSMENAISESNKVATERDRQVQDQLQSMKESIEDLHNNITAFMRTISDRINEHLLHSKTSVKTAKTTVKPEVTSVRPEITSVKPEITTDSIINTDCTTVPESGTYTFYLEFIKSNITVYCDQETDGGGWIVFMRRQDGSVNFTRPWVDYKHGFGSPDGEFWAGNDLLHKLTKERPLQLRIDMEDFNGNTAFAVYDEFKVGAEEDKYRLHVSGYSGTAGDSLIDTSFAWYKHAGMQFSTFDSDDKSGYICAKVYKGGWWYSQCFEANLNGPYSHDKNIPKWKGIIWYSWLGWHEALKRVEMKIR